MLSKDIEHLGDQFSYFVENHCSVTFDMSQMIGFVRQLRSFQNQAEALEASVISDEFKQSEIDQSNGSNVVILDHFRKQNPNQKTTA